MNEHGAGNRKLWDELVDINARSPLYDLPGLLAGSCSLDPLELEEVGDVRGKPDTLPLMFSLKALRR